MLACTLTPLPHTHTVTMGWPWLIKTYVMPYLWVNSWLVMITFLQVGLHVLCV